MIFSHTQIQQYVSCPRKYRYLYLDGWQEKDNRASLLFGRAFETALAALFRREDPGAALYDAWAIHREAALSYAPRENWGKLLEQGIRLLHRFVQDGRITVRNPATDLQLRVSRDLGRGHEFIAYLDAIAELDGNTVVLDWKTTKTRYPEAPSGVLALDPQLRCYSWLTGIEKVAIVAFVRKAEPEVQYVQARISPADWHEYEQTVSHVIEQVESGLFPAHSGIRFPHGVCTDCSCLGLCLENEALTAMQLTRRPGAERAWLNELPF